MKSGNSSLAKETIYSLRELSRKLPINRSRRTLHRWCRTGTLDSKKKKVKLEYVVVFGCLHSSIEAYERFIEKLMEE